MLAVGNSSGYKGHHLFKNISISCSVMLYSDMKEHDVILNKHYFIHLIDRYG